MDRRSAPALALPAKHLGFALLCAALCTAGCKGRDSMTAVSADDLKKGNAPATPAPPPPSPAAPAARAPIEVPELGVRVDAPAGWRREVPTPGHHTIRGASLAEGFVQVNKTTVVPPTPEAAAAQRCVGPNARTLAQERTAAGAIFVVCETELSGNKSRGIHAWLKSPKVGDAAHCTLTTDRNFALIESICRSLRPL